MPLNLQKNLPAVELLKKEHIFVMDSLRASEQDIRPLRVVVLNLMPLKITTETDLVRLLSNTPLQVELDFMKIKGHTPKNTPIEHMKEFYKDFDEMQDDFYDGMIITGAPVEQMPFEEVNYWEEVTEIFDWARTHVTSTLYICWAAQAGLYHFYGVPKYDLPAKMFGVFRHTLREPYVPIFRGFDDEFYVPHSRHTEIRREDVMKVPDLTLLSSGFVLAIFMANAGGAWDNAKKYVEEGNFGGKGSEVHKATVTGDTVGDPFKDTSGPSLNILIKLMSMVAIVMAGLTVAWSLF